ncbi:unnamed protein product [Spirodela intermedia]|uniref:Uncharacterized protein n=1 Tax=Spirodela intermedia TaxID=51605 RepID=A0A7I8K9L0_SPIIN|nr:unnamed protein product [Spirodela intermedia]
MAQEHQEENSVDLVSHTVKRKRGRPRKDEILGSEPSKRNRRARIDGEGHGADPFVGQVVSGVLDGRFDAGYMLTVQVGGGGCVLRGVVFEPGLSVPISSANDVAPNVKMFERNEVSLPSSAWQPPSYTPARSAARRDGACRSRSKSESTAVVEDLNGNNVQMNLSADMARLPGKDSNHACGNLKLEDFQSTGSDNKIIDGIQNLQPARVDLPEASGNPKIISLIPNAAHDANAITSEPKKEAASKDPPIFGNDVETSDLQDAACDTKQTAQTHITKPLLHVPEASNVSNTAQQYETFVDVKLVDEIPLFRSAVEPEKAAVPNAEPSFRNVADIDAESAQSKTSEPEQPAEAAHLPQVSPAEAFDHKQTTEASHAQLPEIINGAEPVTEIPAAEASHHTGQSADTSLGDTVAVNESSEFNQSAVNESTNLPGDAGTVSEVPQIKTMEPIQAAEIVGIHPHQEEAADEPKTAAEQSAVRSDGRPPAQLSEVSIDTEPVAKVSQSGDSQSLEAADSGHDLSNVFPEDVSASKQPSDSSGRGQPCFSGPTAEISESEELCEPSIDGPDLTGDTKSPNLCGVADDAEPAVKSKQEDDDGESEEAHEPSIDGPDLTGGTKSLSLCGVADDAEPAVRSKQEDDNGEASPLDEMFDSQKHLEAPSKEVMTTMAAPGTTESPLGPEEDLPSLPGSGAMEEEPPASGAAAAEANAGLG